MKFRHLKKYGQHFLNNKEIAEKIADLLDDSLTDSTVFEIGPGEGILTSFFHNEKWKAHYYMVEIDDRLIDTLKEQFPLLASNVIHIDFLKFDLGSFQKRPQVIFGNFPYNISSQIVFKMLDHKDTVTHLIGMFQKEVARRITTVTGSKQYGILSVLVNAYYDSEYVVELGPEHFTPPPKVDSAVIKLVRHKNKYEIQNDKIFKSVVKSAFGLRRKKLKNSVKSFNFVDSPEINRYMDLRPEQMSVQDFVHLANAVES